MQQQPNSPPNITSPAIEGMLIGIAGMLIIIGAVLLYLGKIDIGFASFLFMTAFSAAFGLLGINLAYKAPSPAQQAQLSAQNQNVQQMASQVLAVIPMFVNLLHTHAPAQSAVPPQQQVQAPPSTNMTGTAPTAVVRQPVQQPPVVQPTPVRQPAPQAPLVPQTAMAGQQFKLPDISMPMAAMPAQGQPAQQQS